jgi:hypothetical protein
VLINKDFVLEIQNNHLLRRTATLLPLDKNKIKALVTTNLPLKKNCIVTVPQRT